MSKVSPAVWLTRPTYVLVLQSDFRDISICAEVTMLGWGFLRCLWSFGKTQSSTFIWRALQDYFSGSGKVLLMEFRKWPFTSVRTCSYWYMQPPNSLERHKQVTLVSLLATALHVQSCYLARGLEKRGMKEACIRRKYTLLNKIQSSLV